MRWPITEKGFVLVVVASRKGQASAPNVLFGSLQIPRGSVVPLRCEAIETAMTAEFLELN